MLVKGGPGVFLLFSTNLYPQHIDVNGFHACLKSHEVNANS